MNKNIKAPERLFCINIHYATYGIFAVDNIITQAPPIAKWMIGKTLEEIKPFLLEKKAKGKKIKNKLVYGQDTF